MSVEKKAMASVTNIKDAGDLARVSKNREELRSGLESAREKSIVMGEPNGPPSPREQFLESSPTDLGVVEQVPFPIHVLPMWGQCMVKEVAAATQTSQDMAGMLYLGAVSGFVAPHYSVHITNTYIEPLILQTMVALSPGNSKSAVHSMMFAPHRDHEKAEAERLYNEVEMARSKVRVLNRIIEENEKKAAQVTGEKLTMCIANIEHTRGELGKMGRTEHYRSLVEDATPERLAQMIADHGSLFVVSSEGGGVFGSLMRYASKSSSPPIDVFLKGNNAEPLRIDRKNGTQIHLPAVILPAALMVQPEVYRELKNVPSLRGRGFLGRWLYCNPKSLLGLRRADPPSVSERTILEYSQRMHYIASLKSGSTPCSYVPNGLRLTADARSVAADFYGHLEPMLGPGGALDGIQDWASKLHGATYRLAGLIHIANLAEESLPRPEAMPVDGETMDRAVQVAKYLIPHGQNAFNVMQTSHAVLVARHLLAWLQAKKVQTFSQRDAAFAVRGKYVTEDVCVGISTLVAHNVVREVAPVQNKRGRPPGARFEVHPRLSMEPDPPQK